jgi:uncharacterized protein with NRDE domain
MCLCVFAYNHHPDYKLVLAFNRDEFLTRPTKEAHFWEDIPEILAGRDLKQHGTWLGLNTNGKLAFVTNYRDIRNLKEDAPSRGELAVNFLASEEAPFDYLMNLQNPQDYNGFNLVVGDGESLYYYSNIKGEIEKIEPGIHGISNHLMNTEWNKVVRKKEELAGLLKGDFSKDNLFKIMADSRESSGLPLPDTGLEAEIEQKLSAPFITMADYGTVSTTIIVWETSGLIRLYEKRFGQGGGLLNESEYMITNTLA